MVLPTLDIESSLLKKGFKTIVGIDEVGRGSWAGPLVAAGVILPANYNIPEGLADSKLVKPQLRAKLADIIKKTSLGYYISEINVSIINKIGIGKASHIAFRQIVKKIEPKADFALIDAFYINHLSRKNQKAIKNGDKICASIAAASVIAKVYRDSLMRKLHFTYPNYGFAKHKGYGTAHHQQAIRSFGFSKIHRTSYNLDFLFK